MFIVHVAHTMCVCAYVTRSWMNECDGAAHSGHMSTAVPTEHNKSSDQTNDTIGGDREKIFAALIDLFVSSFACTVTKPYNVVSGSGRVRYSASIY